MLVILPALVHKALRHEVGDELDHLDAGVRVLNPLVKDYTHVGRELDVQVEILTVVSLTVHLAEETGHRGQVG